MTECGEEGDEMCDVCYEDQRMMEDLQGVQWSPEGDNPFHDRGFAVESSQVSMPGQDQVRIPVAEWIFRP
jgi:hypothetical protein